MSFLDKFFSHKNRNNKNENLLKTETEPLNFRFSHLNIQKDQIRFVLFRECDRRGRKLLFDSNAVEKIPLPSKGTMCNKKFLQQNSERIIDFVETTTTHGYRYKKPSLDVASLGEMIFGSVAVVYKGENTCKIHIIPSPKQIMFTTIVHPSNYCPSYASSGFGTEDNSRESSLPSINEIKNEQQTSSSDSKLYRRKNNVQNYSSTYPWMQHNSPLTKVVQCCEISDLDFNLKEKLFLHKQSDVKNIESLSVENKCNQSCVFNSKEQVQISSDSLTDFYSPCEKNQTFCQKVLGCEKDSTRNLESSVGNSTGSESVFSGSLSSLRRRWVQSYKTSLDIATYEDINSSPSKRRTKLGMALVLDLSNTLEDNLEKFLLNHTIIIDSIMKKLQSSVELAYKKNENFVDLLYTAFQDSQKSIYELITGGKYETPLWYTLIGSTDDDLAIPIMQKSMYEENVKECVKQSLLNNVQLKFLNDFCDVLIKFDTKDTNFFISTLLTAVLTYHLSWVISIAEDDSSTSLQNLSVIKNLRPYNPLWAQLNDLCGLLGSPLKCAKTIITGAESKKCQMNNIIQVLTYFIRCYNVVENVYEVNIEDIVGNADMEAEELMKNVDSNIDSDVNSSSVFKKLAEERFDFRVVEPEIKTKISNDGEEEFKNKLEKEILLTAEPDPKMSRRGVLKRSKSDLYYLKMENSSSNSKLYPNIEDLAKSEHVNVGDLESIENDRTKIVENFISNEKLTEKIQTLIRAPKSSFNHQLEEYISPDEGYDTIDSTKADNVLPGKVVMEKECSASYDKKENIVFVLGENEELVNLPKKVVVTKSSVINMEKENSNDVVDCDNINSVHSALLNVSVNSPVESENNSRTSENFGNNTWVTCNGSKIKHSQNQVDEGGITSWKIPWMLRELKMPRESKPCRTRRLEVSSVLGGVNQQYNSEQVIQGVTVPKSQWEHKLQKDLFLCAHNAELEKDVNEALCIVGDMDSWEVTVFSSNTSTLDKNKHSEVRVGMSQLVADMLESFLYLHTINLSPSFCLLHIERKLHEIYLKSKTVAELLNSTDLCSIEYLTTRLDIGINDVPLLLSVAATHSPNISEKYGISFT